MNAKKNTIVGALILSAVFFGSTAFAQVASSHPMGPGSEATSLIGKPVNSEAGNYIGKISNLIIDQANDHVSLVVLSGVPGFGSDQSVTSGKAGGMYCEPLKAVFKSWAT